MVVVLYRSAKEGRGGEGDLGRSYDQSILDTRSMFEMFDSHV